MSYTIEQMRQQVRDIRKQLEIIPDGVSPDAIALLSLESDEILRDGFEGSSEVPGILTIEEYMYGRVTRLAGMLKMAHYLLVEIPECRKELARRNRRPYRSAADFLGK